MRRTVVITFLAFTFYVLQFVFYNIFGHWFMPNLLLLLVLFFTLIKGIRIGILTAFISGMVVDSFHMDLFGLNIFSFLICGYLTVLVKRYVYHDGAFSVTFMAFLMSIANIFIQFVVISLFRPLNFYQTVVNILVPETIATTVVAVITFSLLRQCVLRFYV